MWDTIRRWLLGPALSQEREPPKPLSRAETSSSDLRPVPNPCPAHPLLPRRARGASTPRLPAMWTLPWTDIRQHTATTTPGHPALEEGSSYHGYKDPAARPACATRSPARGVPGAAAHLAQARPPGPMTDYHAIMARDRHPHLGGGAGRQGGLAVGLPRRGDRPVGVQHGRAVRRHQQQRPGPARPARAGQHLHRLPLQLPARRVRGGGGPHAPDRGGAAPDRPAPVLGHVRGQAGRGALRLGALSAQRPQRLRLGEPGPRLDATSRTGRRTAPGADSG